MNFEKSVGIFSPDGRLIQLEYAQQASELGSLVVFASNGTEICVSFENKATSKLLIEDPKLAQIDENVPMWYAYSGIKPDSYVIFDRLVGIHAFTHVYQENDIDIDVYTQELSFFVQRFTVRSDRRPLGVRSVLFSCVGGRSQIMVLDPDGNYSEYRAGAIGHDSGKVCEYIEKCDNEDIVYKSVSALGQIIQTDKNKITSYVLSDGGSKVVDDVVIDEILKSAAK